MKTLLPMAGSFLRPLCFLLCFLPFVAWSADPAPAAPRQEVKILTIGNSFADNAMTFLPKLAEAGGKKLTYFRANLGGHSLAQHAGYMQAFEADPNDPKGRPYKKNPADPSVKISLREALESNNWDYVTIQQVSGQSFQPETFQPYANTLIAYIHKYAPHAEILIHETWAYPDDYYEKFKAEKLDRPTMHARVKAAYQKLSDETGLRILPVGDAFQAVATSANPINLTIPGDKHANANGQYLGGAVFYEMIFRDNVEKVNFVPEKVTPADAEALRRVAHETVAQAAKHQPAAAPR
ncbi:MAG: DUF4886 domain-containing protein [Chthoniobacteraceae bacterium]|nr:DUF4886 domain-containing protein [Chthoniobacteraceae bacterium]